MSEQPSTETVSKERLEQLIDIAMCRRVDGTDWRADMATALRELQALRVSAPAKRISGNGITEPFRFLCLRPDHVDVYDEHVLASDYDKLRSALTARERQLAVANKLWQLCVKEDFPWADGSTQDALTELGLLYAKDMTDEDPSERCKNCDDDCSTCYRAVERIEDAAMEKANG